MLHTEHITLQTVAKTLGIDDPKHIKVYFKKGKVTTNCRVNGHTFGSRGTTLAESFLDLLNRVNNHVPLPKNGSR